MRQRNTSNGQFMSEYVPTAAKQTIRYAKAKNYRARIWLENNQSQIRWKKGNPVITYKPYAITR